MQERHMTDKKEITIDLRRVFQALLKRVWVIVAVTLIFGLLAYILSATMIDPTYRSSFTAYVNNKATINTSSGSTTTADVNASMALAAVYQEIIVSRTVLEEAAKACVSTTADAVKYYCVVAAVLGEDWLTNRYFRIGASRLANNLLSDIWGEEVKYF